MSQFLLKTMEYSIYATLASMITGCSALMPRVPITAFESDHYMYLSYVEQVPVDAAHITAPVASNTLATASAIDMLIDTLPALAEAHAEYTSKTISRSIEIFVSNTNDLSEASVKAILQSFNQSIISR